MYWKTLFKEVLVVRHMMTNEEGLLLLVEWVDEKNTQSQASGTEDGIILFEHSLHGNS